MASGLSPAPQGRSGVGEKSVAGEPAARTPMVAPGTTNTTEAAMTPTSRNDRCFTTPPAGPSHRAPGKTVTRCRRMRQKGGGCRDTSDRLRGSERPYTPATIEPNLRRGDTHGSRHLLPSVLDERGAVRRRHQETRQGR